MRKLFTYPNNPGTDYVLPEHHAGATTRWEAIRNGSYRAHTNPTGFSLTTSQMLQNTSKYIYYYLDHKGYETPASRYDVWEQPLIEFKVGTINHHGWKTSTVDITNLLDTSWTITTLEDDAHDFLDGQIMYKHFVAPHPTWEWNYHLASGSEQHYVVEKINDTTVKCYGAELWADPLPNFSGETVLSYGQPTALHEHMTFRVNDSSKYEFYDCVPRIQQHLERDFEKHLEDQEYFITNYSDGLFSNDPMSSAGNEYGSMITGYPVSDFAGFTAHKLYYEYYYDSEFKSVSDIPWQLRIGGSGLVAWGGCYDSGLFPVGYTPNMTEYSVTLVEDPSTDHDGQGPLSWLQFMKPNHGLVNGDIVNITHADNINIHDWWKQMIVRGGTGIPYFVDRIDDNSFRLLTVPYRTATNRDVVFADTTWSVRFSWDSDTTSLPESGETRIAIRKANVIPKGGWQEWRTMASHGVYPKPRVGFSEFTKANNMYYSNSNTWGTGQIYDGTFGLGASSFEPIVHKVKTVNVVYPGNYQYRWTDSGGNTQPGAVLNRTGIYAEGRALRLARQQAKAGFVRTQYGNVYRKEIFPDASITTDANGYITGATVTTTGYLSRDYDGVVFPGGVQTGYDPGPWVPFVMAVNSQASEQLITSEDDWDTHDYWTTEGYDENRVWPSHVTPRKAQVTVVQPSATNLSQSGIKYVRSTGIVRYQVEFEYPPLTEEQFAPFLAAVQGARGQYRPFLLPLRAIKKGDDVGILFQKPGKPCETRRDLRFTANHASGSKVIFLEGYDSDEVAVLAGQHLILDQISNSNKRSNGNGGLYTVLHDQESNIFGECKFRVAYPTRDSFSAGDYVEEQPMYAVVTLGEDNFEYTTDYQGFYALKVIFGLDEFK